MSKTRACCGQIAHLLRCGLFAYVRESIHVELPEKRTIVVDDEALAFKTWIDVEHWRLEACKEKKILFITRTPKPFSDLNEVGAAWEPILQATKGLKLSEWALCIDMREAPPTHDPDYEAAIRHCRKTLSGHTRRYAGIVKSVAGLMHATRLSREDRDADRIKMFRDDELAALRYVLK